MATVEHIPIRNTQISDHTPRSIPYGDAPELPTQVDTPNLTLRQAARHERQMTRWLNRLGRREARRRARVLATYRDPEQWREEVRERNAR